ncbi:MAG TPA: FAD-binding oxidoreductase [Beijerinckiaceae bacterium]|nr:FAD-binding oxidoreductase [Beijerinckiaceae bacterium]
MFQAAEIVIIGAGAIGCSIAMHLAEGGAKDVLVIDKAGITHGSTWHAAGLVGQYRSAEDLARLMNISVRLFETMQTETPIDWKPVGSLRVAASVARMRELAAAEPIARSYGIDLALLTPGEARGLYPYLNADDLHGAAFLPGDGYVDPSSLTQALAGKARRGGVRFVENTPVGALAHKNGRCTGVETAAGRIDCEKLVITGGVWARAIGRMLGLNIPVAAVAHQYAVTGKRTDMPPNLPVLRDPDADFYVKPEVGGFAIGGWEAEPVLSAEGEMPSTFGMELLPDDLERMLPVMEKAFHRIPVVGDVGIRRIVNGPIPVSPDGEPMLGRATGFSNVYLGCGFTSGIAACGGAGQQLARLIQGGAFDFPIPSLDPARFGPATADFNEMNRQACRAYAGYYKLSASNSELAQASPSL